MTEYVSINPETFVDGGGLIDDSDGIFKDFRWVMADLRLIKQGMDPTDGGDPSPYLNCNIEVAGEDYPIWWSAGGAAFFEPSADGKQMKAKSTAKGINAKSNAGIFLASLYNNGFPTAKMGSDITVLDGLEAHFIREPEPSRKGLNRPEGDKGGRTVVVITEINKLPWESKKGGGSKKSKGNGKKPIVDDDLGQEVAELVIGALSENLEGVPKKDLIKLVVSGIDSSKKPAALKCVNSDDWLNSREEWAYEDGVVQLP